MNDRGGVSTEACTTPAAFVVISCDADPGCAARPWAMLFHACSVRLGNSLYLAIVCLFACGALTLPRLQAESPRSPDERIRVELFAEHPPIMTPTGLAVDRRGRVFVAESHTHFRPDHYDGPPADQILIFEDTDGDGRADKKQVFHEGFTYVMDIEFHHDGSLYVATRMDIHRLRDTNSDDRADEITPIVRLETKGNYPHNGLSGIAFVLNGGFHFGLGENLGEAYTLIGSDGVRIAGGGEGGSTYWVNDQGQKLRRVSTGWWNPYGMCTDSYGRVFGTDNDPDASPPCRLIQVVQDADYGYEFRYGRSGRNPLVAWDGEIPGTLPMIAGTGEAPCHIVAYESDALPSEYFGQLLVPSWADHRVEHYALEQRPDRGLVSTTRKTLVEGPDDFRPVGIDVAPDGTVYISDWVSSSYTLHKQGRIWRIRPAEFPKLSRPADPALAVQARDRRVREMAARELLRSPQGNQVLELQVRQATLPQVRATCLQALGSIRGRSLAAEVLPRSDQPCELHAVAARYASRANSAQPLWKNFELACVVRAEELLTSEFVAPQAFVDSMFFREHSPFVGVDSPDPLLMHAAISALARGLAHPDYVELDVPNGIPHLPRLLAVKRSRSANPRRAEEELAAYLHSTDPQVRFAAVKWVADDRLSQFRPQLETLLNESDLDLATFLAIQVALQRLHGQQTLDRPPNERLLEKITSNKGSSAIRRLALRLIDPTFAALRVEHLTALLGHDDEGISLEALRTLIQHPDRRRLEQIVSVARDRNQSSEFRATAVAGLAVESAAYRELLVELACDADSRVRDEALRSLVGTELTGEQRDALGGIAGSASVTEAVARVVNKSLPARPRASDLDRWSALLPADGDPHSGERIFFGTKVGTCSKCHQATGRGAAVGPDLSRISARVAYLGPQGQRWLLETILQPSREMAPQFTPWLIVTKDGKQLTGLPRRKGGNAEAYLGIDGREFSLKNQDIEFHRESDVSIMPAELLLQFTTQELADLFAYLKS